MHTDDDTDPMTIGAALPETTLLRALLKALPCKKFALVRNHIIQGSLKSKMNILWRHFTILLLLAGMDKYLKSKGKYSKLQLGATISINVMTSDL